MGSIRDAAALNQTDPLGSVSIPEHVTRCVICGIPVRYLSLANNGRGAVIHAEPRATWNDFHNGTADHNAKVIGVEQAPA